MLQFRKKLNSELKAVDFNYTHKAVPIFNKILKKRESMIKVGRVLTSSCSANRKTKSMMQIFNYSINEFN